VLWPKAAVPAGQALVGLLSAAAIAAWDPQVARVTKGAFVRVGVSAEAANNIHTMNEARHAEAAAQRPASTDWLLQLLRTAQFRDAARARVDNWAPLNHRWDGESSPITHCQGPSGTQRPGQPLAKHARPQRASPRGTPVHASGNIGLLTSPFAFGRITTIARLLVWGARPCVRNVQGRALRSQASCSSAPLRGANSL
jgi:hypothetical protein